MPKKELTQSQRAELIPRLKPGAYNAVQVLQFVKKAVRKEPTRMEMGTWMAAYAGRIFDGFYANSPLPQCGTVACLAGWINIATGHYKANLPSRSFGAGESAIKHLGLSLNQNAASALDELFGNTNLEPDEVIKEIDSIIAAYKSELTAAKVRVR